MDDDGFQVVSGRKKKGRKKTGKAITKSELIPQSTSPNTNIDKTSVIRKIFQCRHEIELSDFISDIEELVSRIKDHLEDTYDRNTPLEGAGRSRGSNPSEAGYKDYKNKQFSGELVCYGIGHFSDCIIARYQMALLLILRDSLKVSKAQCLVYDPVMTEAEKTIAEDLNLQIIKINEVGKRQVMDSAVLYMPHCGKALYNNLLWANWSPETLQRLVIIGNSFSNMNDRTPRRLMETEARYILRILPYVTDVPLPNRFAFKDIFNDISTHLFEQEKLVAAPGEVWQDHTEPLYTNDVEIITTG